ncbi:MAG: FAD-dependent oxidoreductase [Candidatus Eisenbacteria bacterium]|uniref:FAD-dependent oxidoreductase n=1 Tax=Eiseniibacteriota bacterium TaxID=2212470 RepID=A0A948RWA0_UNCEI|nr:FAD-dependent oxidoreductase [Candidatus Eisenbacteria bacterium]MBU1949209.1 FAD-dependent oxidoreductase [Candidatus Eisenbacteria bacterium]MBU2689434.1 FAD-dependent oxidoreductase [Candidatus Eisenbacteria bacterium]
MKSKFDLLIVGGGIFGATALWHAARRGISACLIDRSDFGSGASSSSMKILHGGLRYLQSADFRRSLESIRERRRLLRLAPSRIERLPCRQDPKGCGPLFPWLLRTGLLLNNIISIRGNVGVQKDKQIPPARYPFWYDGLMTDTERLLIDFIRAAHEIGGSSIAARNYAGIIRTLEKDGRITGMEIRDHGKIEAGAILYCTGPAGGVRPAVLAINLLVDRLPLNRDGTAVAMRHPGDGRNVFFVPWRDRSIIGTINRSYPYDPAEKFRFDSAWLNEAIDWLRPVHPDLSRLSPSDIRFIHAGLLPGDLSGGIDPSHKDTLRRRGGGGWELQGVKYTTACGVSEKAVERISREMGISIPKRPADDRPMLPDMAAARERWIAADPSRQELLDSPGLRIRRGDLLFAVEEEWALTIGDILLRRTGLAAAGHPGRRLVDLTSRIVQDHFGFEEGERMRQVDDFNDDWRFAGNIPG